MVAKQHVSNVSNSDKWSQKQCCKLWKSQNGQATTSLIRFFTLRGDSWIRGDSSMRGDSWMWSARNSKIENSSLFSLWNKSRSLNFLRVKVHCVAVLSSSRTAGHYNERALLQLGRSTRNCRYAYIRSRRPAWNGMIFNHWTSMETRCSAIYKAIDVY